MIDAVIKINLNFFIELPITSNDKQITGIINDLKN